MSTKLTPLDISRIEECHPQLQRLFYAAANDPDCPKFTVIDGARTLDEQKRNFARGASKTMRSRHLKGKNGWSHAIDTASLVNGKISWNWAYYYPLEKAIKRIAKELNIPIKWGGDWKSFKDGPHWELPWKIYSGNKKAADNVEPDFEIQQIEKELNTHDKPREGVGNFRISIPLILDHEGGYVNHPKDKGGPTYKGVTLANFRKYHNSKATITGLKNASDDVIVDIYKRHYWDAVRADMLPAGVDHAVFDFAVNSGINRPIPFLQRIVGVKDDGKIGTKTLEAVNAMSPVKIVDNLCDMRLEYLQKRPNASTFLSGWTKRVERVRKEALSMVQKPDTETKSPPGKSLIALIFKLIGVLFGKKG